MHPTTQGSIKRDPIFDLPVGVRCGGGFFKHPKKSEEGKTRLVADTPKLVDCFGVPRDL